MERIRSKRHKRPDLEEPTPFIFRSSAERRRRQKKQERKQRGIDPADPEFTRLMQAIYHAGELERSVLESLADHPFQRRLK